MKSKFVNLWRHCRAFMEENAVAYLRIGAVSLDSQQISLWKSFFCLALKKLPGRALVWDEFIKKSLDWLVTAFFSVQVFSTDPQPSGSSRFFTYFCLLLLLSASFELSGYTTVFSCFTFSYAFLKSPLSFSYFKLTNGWTLTSHTWANGLTLP